MPQTITNKTGTVGIVIDKWRSYQNVPGRRLAQGSGRLTIDELLDRAKQSDILEQYLSRLGMFEENALAMSLDPTTGFYQKHLTARDIIEAWISRQDSYVQMSVLLRVLSSLVIIPDCTVIDTRTVVA